MAISLTILLWPIVITLLILIISEWLLDKDAVIGGLKAAFVVSNFNLMLIALLYAFGVREYPTDAVSGNAMGLGEFAIMTIFVGGIWTCCIGAQIWSVLQKKYGRDSWRVLGLVGLGLAALMSLPLRSDSPTGDAAVISTVLHFSTALLAGYWLIPHFHPSGCPCGFCPICEADSTVQD